MQDEANHGTHTQAGTSLGPRQKALHLLERKTLYDTRRHAATTGSTVMTHTNIAHVTHMLSCVYIYQAKNGLSPVLVL